MHGQYVFSIGCPYSVPSLVFPFSEKASGSSYVRQQLSTGAQVTLKPDRESTGHNCAARMWVGVSLIPTQQKDEREPRQMRNKD